MGFLMDGLDAEAYDRQYTDGQLIRRIGSYFRPQAALILTAGAMVLCGAILDASLPVLISTALDRLSAGQTLPQLAVFGAAIVCLATISWCFNWVKQTRAARVVGAIVLKLREDASDAVLNRDMSFYDQFPSGKIVSRVTSDTAAFSQVLVLTIDMVGRSTLVVLIIAYLFTISWRLALILLVIAPFIVFAALGFRRIARSSITQSRRMNGVVNSHIQETVSGIGVAKTFRQEQTIYDEFLTVNTQARKVSMRVRYVFSSIFPLLNIMAGWGTAALIYFGAGQVTGGAITPGQWFLFLQGLMLFWFPLTSIASFWSQFQIGLAAGERVFALIDAEPRVVQTADEPAGTLRGAIAFQQLSFRYQTTNDWPTADDRPSTAEEQQLTTDDRIAANLLRSSVVGGQSSAWVLRDFDLTIRPGETLALVGHTGSGKSSIAKLIARFYEFQSGALLVDGRDIRRFDLADYRSKLGIVTQTPFLFDGSVADNIRYGRPDASDEQVAAAARHVGGGDWVQSLPNGLASVVGERGARLSMGQRQLVALARVLLQDPAIIIMDEATASIDPLTEALIQEGLDVLLRDRTAIVIAHRLSTVQGADRIVVLRKGAIIEQGDHEGLLVQGGHYAELYNTYFRHQSLEYIEQAGAVVS